METDLVKIVGSYTPLTKAGLEWRGPCCIHNGDGPNLYVNPQKQVWACFSQGCHERFGADAIGFLRSMGMSMNEARETLGIKTDWKPTLRMPAKPAPKEWISTKPPAGSRPNLKMKHLGEPVAQWEYKDADGELLGIVARYETKEGKEYRQFSYGADEGWQCRHFTKPRPLYGAELLAEHPDYRVAIVEGEKAADAARQILPEGWVAVTFPGGCKAWRFADFEPLRGRTVLLWPDADEPGRDAMRALGMVLRDKKGLACE